MLVIGTHGGTRIDSPCGKKGSRKILHRVRLTTHRSVKVERDREETRNPMCHGARVVQVVAARGGILLAARSVIRGLRQVGLKDFEDSEVFRIHARLAAEAMGHCRGATGGIREWATHTGLRAKPCEGRAAKRVGCRMQGRVLLTIDTEVLFLRPAAYFAARSACRVDTALLHRLLVQHRLMRHTRLD
jgi:hypothetical protein